jgi:hypothetical protein
MRIRGREAGIEKREERKRESARVFVYQKRSLAMANGSSQWLRCLIPFDLHVTALMLQK